MTDAIVNTFKMEFDRFHDLLVQQIGNCPNQEVWNKKIGRFTYWWHLFHAFSIVEMYALPLDAPTRQTYLPRDVVFAKAEPARAMTREEMHSLAASMKELAHEFFASQSEKTLLKKNERMSKALGRDLTNLNALIGFLRHYNYHMGCIDSHLRSHGIPGAL